MTFLKVKVTKHHFHKHWHFVRPIHTTEDGEQIELPALPPALPAPRIFAPHYSSYPGPSTQGSQLLDVIYLNLNLPKVLLQHAGQAALVANLPQ
jgi:hypothetical protein